MTIQTGLSMLGTIVAMVMSIISIILARKDKSNEDTNDVAYRRGQIDKTLQTIIEKIDKIEAKLDNYDNEIDKRVDKAIEQHILAYHKKGE